MFAPEEDADKTVNELLFIFLYLHANHLFQFKWVEISTDLIYISVAKIDNIYGTLCILTWKSGEKLLQIVYCDAMMDPNGFRDMGLINKLNVVNNGIKE